MPYKNRTAQYEEARSLRSQGLTLQAISDLVDVPLRTIHTWTKDVTTSEIISANKVRHTGPNFAQRKPLPDILVENSTFRTSWLRERLLEEKVIPFRCNRCGLTEWLNKPVPLELEHKNGISNDNRLENLELLCPNCHALTPTYRGRNIKKGKGA